MNKSQKNIPEYEVNELGSLGLLALGYKGLRIWREKKLEIQKEKHVKKKK